ncbi:MAG: type I methionyl aminopeptidase [Spirochaetes bacterium]|nr:type I methionyl aminopeptidase [Spirochaetota bacterium]
MIFIKSKDEIERIRECGIISANLFEYLKPYIIPGITTREIEKIAENFIIKNGATPSFNGYEGFPSSICASVNEEIIHGIPCNRKLKEGDIIGIDVGIKKNGLISDSAHTYPVGKISQEVQLLLKRTELALYKGIKTIHNNIQINEISGTIEDYAKQFGYGIVREYCGHGVGYKNHEDPEVPNYRFKKGRRRIKSGTVIAIEPMINLGSGECFVLEDGWTVVTIDGKYSAHYEHTIAITEDGFDILTILPEDLDEIKKKMLLS